MSTQDFLDQLLVLVITFVVPLLFVSVKNYLAAKEKEALTNTASNNHWIIQAAIDNGIKLFEALVNDFEAHKAAIIAHVQIVLNFHHIPIDATLIEQTVEANIKQAAQDNKG